MTDLLTIQTRKAPKAIGPYSQAIRSGDLIFTAGQIPLDPETMELKGGDDISAQTDQVLRNVKAILEEAGGGLETVVKTTVFLADMDDFAAMNEVYGKYFNTHKPARSTVQAARLPKDVKVEIDAVAAVRY